MLIWDACRETGLFPCVQWVVGAAGGGPGSAWEADTGGGKEWRAGLAAAQGQSFCVDKC